VKAVSNATNAPVVIWDGGVWDFEEGVDFEPGEWPKLACELKAIAHMLGGHGSAAEIVHRDKACNVKERIFRWHYIARNGWRGVL
jgi:hypothetical protein